MKFKRTTQNHQTFYASNCGKYKAVKYGKYWFAYFKPDGWPNFGNSCGKTPGGVSIRFTSKKATINYCELHHEKFGANLDQRNHVITKSAYA